MLVLYIYIYKTRLASNEIFSQSNKIQQEVRQAKDLSAPLYLYFSDFLVLIRDEIFPLFYWHIKWKILLSITSVTHTPPNSLEI